MNEQLSPVSIDHLRREQTSNIISIFEEAGYILEVKATHQDEKGGIHLRRHLNKKPYPHLHLIFNLATDQFKVHLDIRKHRAIDVSPHVSAELERLHQHFSKKLDSRPVNTTLISSLAKQAIALAMFNLSDKINHKKSKLVTNLQKMNNSRKLRKTKQTDTFIAIKETKAPE